MSVVVLVLEELFVYLGVWMDMVVKAQRSGEESVERSLRWVEGGWYVEKMEGQELVDQMDEVC